MANSKMNRRRALMIIAASGAAPAAALARPAVYSWRGAVLGAKAGMAFYGASRSPALAVTRQCLAEVDRLENIFSLYRANSEISRLNRTGQLAGATQDMRALLGLSRRISAATGGAFDPTVQALWRWRTGQNGKGDAPLHLVDYRTIRSAGGRVRLGRGQSITLNGIAQGYITDRVCALLRAAGWRHVLVNLGEYRAIDAKPDGTAFTVALAGTGQTIELDNMALASSSPDGFVFGGPGQNRAGHLFNPHTGTSADGWTSIHVRHPAAAIADGLSTAFSCMDEPAIRQAVKAFPGTTCRVVGRDGAVRAF